MNVSYCHEKILLHLQLGDQPSRDFCTSCREAAIPTAGADFSNELHQQLHEMRCQMWRVGAGGGQPSRQQVHICLKAFIFMFFIAEGASDIASLIRDSPG